jgi:hypothetical protein
MKPEEIELLIDRICGYFPTTNIARNTLKNAWGRDDLLLDANVNLAKQVLKKVEGLDRFPNLAEVKTLFRNAMGMAESVFCEFCERTGWDSGVRYINGKREGEYYTTTFQGRTYNVVRPCQCRTGKSY